MFKAVQTVFISLVLLCLASPGVHAQDDNQLWTALFTNGPVSEDSDFRLWFDGHARFSNDQNGLGVSIIRPGVGYALNDRVTLWAGYAWVANQIDGARDTSEHRIWQQATYRLASGPWGTLSGRTRLEQRFLNTGDETGHRIRQFFRYIKPVNELWSITAWNETFVALNDTDFGAEAGFDQNRLFLGARFRAFGWGSVEMGYLLNNLNRAQNQTNHNIGISIIAPL